VKEPNTPHRLILSGSPLQNNLRELRSLFFVIHLSCTTGDTGSEGAEHPPPPHPLWVAPAEQPEGALDPPFCNPLVLVLQVTRALKELNTPNRLMLSGSPLQNNLRELWILLFVIHLFLYSR
jgi:hypothetical protein